MLLNQTVRHALPSNDQSIEYKRYHLLPAYVEIALVFYLQA